MPENGFFQFYQKIAIGGRAVTEAVTGFFNSNWWIAIQVFWVLLGLALTALMVVVVFKLKKLRQAERAEAKAAIERVRANLKQEHKDWQKVIDYLNTDNPAEWRQAIIEADILLDHLVKRMGYTGETLGERLKQIEPSDFLTLNQAWEAHKVRNMIAHQQDYQLTHREAKRVIGLYEEVFREFHYI
ncbi:MAG: hypothetical protein ACOCU8_01975 [Patescibacteria group bacterium]